MAKKIGGIAAEGAFIAIPVGDRWRLAKILFASSYFRDVILVELFDAVADDSTKLLKGEHSRSGELYYTGLQPIRSKRWQILSSGSVSDEERNLSLRTSGGEVWFLDDYLRKASDADLENLPKMLVYGATLIEKYAAAILAS